MLWSGGCVARCVVVGGNGFLGSYMVDELVAQGHEVTAFDRFSASTPAYTASGVRTVVGDFLNTADLHDMLGGQDYVFHFLSTTTPASAEDDPSLDVRTNVSQSVQMLELAVEAGVSKVYFASTGGAIYGDQDAPLIGEDSLPVPVSPYAIGKQAIEGYLRYFHRKHGLESVSFRISNPYGGHGGAYDGICHVQHRQWHGKQSE
jgi:UDP-glucose 4-epimerase